MEILGTNFSIRKYVLAHFLKKKIPIPPPKVPTRHGKINSETLAALCPNNDETYRYCTPPEINMEPKNYPCARENHFPNLHYCLPS